MIKIVDSDGNDNILISDNSHSDLLEASEYELNDVRQKFPGLLGETELQDRPGGRDLAVQVWLFASDSASMNASIQTTNELLNKLTGTLVMSGNLSGSWKNITFKGFTKTNQGIRRDAAANRVYCQGVLKFRQHTQDVT